MFNVHTCSFRVAPPGDRVFFDCKTNIGKGEQIRWLHNGNRLDKQTKYVKIGDGELTIRVSEKSNSKIYLHIFTFSLLGTQE